jgi:hypothetical protein
VEGLGGIESTYGVGVYLGVAVVSGGPRHCQLATGLSVREPITVGECHLDL